MGEDARGGVWVDGEGAQGAAEDAEVAAFC